MATTFRQTIQTREIYNSMNKQEILKQAMDAVTASGRKFSEIKKESFLNFFEKEGVSKKMWESLYSDLENAYSSKKNKYDAVQGSVSMDYTSDKISESKPLDYYSNNTQNDVKQRTPRKNIFGEISKIAG
jgi:hypothetical protein